MLLAPQAHAGYHEDCATSITDSLAAFLIGAGRAVYRIEARGGARGAEL